MPFLQPAACAQQGDDPLPLPFPLTPLQPFAPIYDSVKNEACRTHALKFLMGLKEKKIWALKMYDSSGKISSGVLRGNVKWMGDEKECFSVASEPSGKEGAEDEIIRGQYCAAFIFVEPKNAEVAPQENKSQRMMDEIFDLIHTNNNIRSNHYEYFPRVTNKNYNCAKGLLTATPHVRFFPSFSPMHIGLCVPHTCTPSDLRIAISEWLFPGNTSQVLGLDANVVVYDDACMKDELKMSTKGKIFLGFCALMTLLGIVGFVYDTKMEKQMKEGDKVEEKGLTMRVLLAFSFRRTLRNLLDTDAPLDELSCINGMRAIFTLILYLIHKCITILFLSISNRDDLNEYMTGNLSMMMRAFWGLVDTFVFMSGFLTAYYAFKTLGKGQRLNIMKMYLQRYLKFTPVFLMIVLWVENIAPHMVSESQYLIFGKFLADNCKNKWLNILTYTNTLKGINDMCYINAHQLETDMHMYLLSPFIILFMWKMPKTALLSILGAMATLSYSKYRLVIAEELTSVLYYGSYVSETAKAADAIYLNFIYRLVPYLSGILLAYYLKIHDKKRKLPKVFLFIGSIIALWSAHYTFLRMERSSRPGYNFDATESATFCTIQPLLWCFTMSWVFYICTTRQAEWLNRFLSWKGFLITTRLSYAFYLCQMCVMLIEAGASSNPVTFTPSLVIDLNTLAKVLMATIWLTLLFIMPLADLWNILTTASSTKPEKKED